MNPVIIPCGKCEQKRMMMEGVKIPASLIIKKHGNCPSIIEYKADETPVNTHRATGRPRGRPLGKKDSAPRKKKGAQV